MTTAAEAVVARLIAAGTSCVFLVPGESFLDILNVLRDEPSIHSVVCRHEAAAGNMADAYGKLTGRPGVCLVSRGPGAAHASIACHTAMQDGTPMIMIVADVTSAEREREAFQEADFSSMFASLSKRVVRLDDPSRTAELIDTALGLATAGRPGPVIVTIPENVLAAEAGPASRAPRRQAALPGVDPCSIDKVGQLLAAARHPMVVVGGGGWTQSASDSLADFARASGVPIAAAFRCQDVIDNDAPAYIGHLGMGTSPQLWQRLAAADLIVNVGARFDSPTTRHFSAFDPAADRTIVHFYPDPDGFARWPFPDIGVVATPADAVRALTALTPPDDPARHDQLDELRAGYEQWRTPAPASAPMDLATIVAALPGIVGPDCVVTTGAGNYASWVHRYFRFRQVGSYLGPKNGAMGYGVPAAVAAKLLKPGATVIAFAGDGCFMMAGHELATIKRYGLKILVIVINNGLYGTIRMHQDRRFPDRPFATDLTNPDFARLAEAHGLSGHVVDSTVQFGRAVEAALKSADATLIEVRAPASPALATDPA